MSERLQSVQQTWVDDATGKTRTANFAYDEKGGLVQGKNGEGAENDIPAGELPADFPGRDIFRRAGYGTIEAVRMFRRRGPFTRIEGIDSLTSQAAEMWLAMTPEDAGDAAAATSADANATATNTKVSESGGGSEAAGPTPPAKDTRRGAKQDGSVGSDSTLGSKDAISAVADASTVSDGKPAPAAGHGTEGFIVGDGPGTHLTTNLTVADGATKTQSMSEGGEGVSDNTAKGEVQKSGKLPPDFPGKSSLDAAGVHTYKQLEKYKDDYTQVPGVGDATAKKIEEALKG